MWRDYGIHGLVATVYTCATSKLLPGLFIAEFECIHRQSGVSHVPDYIPVVSGDI